MDRTMRVFALRPYQPFAARLSAGYRSAKTELSDPHLRGAESCY